MAKNLGVAGHAIQCNAVKVQLDPMMEQAELQNQLQELAGEIVSSLSVLDPSQSKELLGGFVSEPEAGGRHCGGKSARRTHGPQTYADYR